MMMGKRGGSSAGHETTAPAAVRTVPNRTPAIVR